MFKKNNYEIRRKIVILQPFIPSKVYSTRKTLAQCALDLALLMANAQGAHGHPNVENSLTLNYKLFILQPFIPSKAYATRKTLA